MVARWRCFQLREYHRSLISLSLEVKVDVCEYHRSLLSLSLPPSIQPPVPPPDQQPPVAKKPKITNRKAQTKSMKLLLLPVYGEFHMHE